MKWITPFWCSGGNEYYYHNRLKPTRMCQYCWKNRHWKCTTSRPIRWRLDWRHTNSSTNRINKNKRWTSSFKSLSTFWLLGLGSVHLCPGHYPSKRFQVYHIWLQFHLFSNCHSFRSIFSEAIAFSSPEEHGGKLTVHSKTQQITIEKHQRCCSFQVNLSSIGLPVATVSLSYCLECFHLLPAASKSTDSSNFNSFPLNLKPFNSLLFSFLIILLIFHIILPTSSRILPNSSDLHQFSSIFPTNS